MAHVGRGSPHVRACFHQTREQLGAAPGGFTAEGTIFVVHPLHGACGALGHDLKQVLARVRVLELEAHVVAAVAGELLVGGVDRVTSPDGEGGGTRAGKHLHAAKGVGRVFPGELAAERVQDLYRGQARRNHDHPALAPAHLPAPAHLVGYLRHRGVKLGRRRVRRRRLNRVFIRSLSPSRRVQTLRAASLRTTHDRPAPT